MPVNKWIIQGDQIVSSDAIPFPYDDCGFLYGYGLFETIRILDKTPLLLDAHYRRLHQSAILMDIMFDLSLSELVRLVQTLIEKNECDNGTLNLYLTGGNRSQSMYHLGLDIPAFWGVIRPSTSGVLSPLSLGLRQTSFQRIHLDGMKTMSWFKNIMEKRLAPEFNDILLYNDDDYILEATTANVFFIKSGEVITPKSPDIISGITRQFVLDLCAKEGIAVHARPVPVSELAEFDEIFLTNAGHGIIEVKELENYDFLNSKTLTTSIKEWYSQSVVGESQKYLVA